MSWTLPRRSGALAVGEDPEVGGDAGVVEELVGQRDDGLEPVVLDDPPADLGLARAGRAGEQRRAVEDDREPRAALRSAGFIFEIMCCRNRKLPSLMRGRPGAEAAAEAIPVVLGLDDVGLTFFHSTPNGGLASR